MPWATAFDVKRYTGQVVDEDDVEPAQPIVELFAGTTEAASDQDLISPTNLRLLKMAVAYQTVWMLAHPDLFTHVDLEGVSQDGVSGQYSHENARLLAPLAWRSIRRLSWRQAPWRIRPRHGRVPDTGTRDSAAVDDNRVWIPMRASGERAVY